MSERSEIPGQPYVSRPGPRQGSDDARVASRAHLFGLANLVSWPLGMVGILLVYYTRGRRSPYVRHQAAQALNFWLTLSMVIICLIVNWLTLFVGSLLGIFVVFLIVWVYGLVMGAVGAIAARSGRSFRYPLTAAVF
ncbi:DUF4870 domain-containing protein [Microbispora sp. CA-135349]|uniref:DUF4870 domain-containing protein n=1 Tax=Microbispora sp. CA-135349 TaxID=3239953 RepID=UPI003D8F9605